MEEKRLTVKQIKRRWRIQAILEGVAAIIIFVGIFAIYFIIFFDLKNAKI